MTRYVVMLVAVALATISMIGAAEAPDIKSGTPVIYLADNLDEKDKLGWCIDTKGRGFSEILHAHSCKPDRGKDLDTQFSWHEESGQIRSVAFEGKCMTLNKPADPVEPFGLLDCTSDESAQQFVYDPESMEIRPATDPSQCVVVAQDSRAAGPFMSRDLIYASCQSIAKKHKQWIIKNR